MVRPKSAAPCDPSAAHQEAMSAWSHNRRDARGQTPAGRAAQRTLPGADWDAASHFTFADGCRSMRIAGGRAVSTRPQPNNVAGCMSPPPASAHTADQHFTVVKGFPHTRASGGRRHYPPAERDAHASLLHRVPPPKGHPAVTTRVGRLLRHEERFDPATKLEGADFRCNAEQRPRPPQVEPSRPP
jgi:hypothetical protein